MLRGDAGATECRRGRAAHDLGGGRRDLPRHRPRRDVRGLLFDARVELMAEETETEIREELAAADAVRPEKFERAICIRGLKNQLGDAVIHEDRKSVV